MQSCWPCRGGGSGAEGEERGRRPSQVACERQVDRQTDRQRQVDRQTDTISFYNSRDG